MWQAGGEVRGLQVLQPDQLGVVIGDATGRHVIELAASGGALQRRVPFDGVPVHAFAKTSGRDELGRRVDHYYLCGADSIGSLRTIKVVVEEG